jgi:hypothetical protein
MPRNRRHTRPGQAAFIFMDLLRIGAVSQRATNESAGSAIKAMRHPERACYASLADDASWFRRRRSSSWRTWLALRILNAVKKLTNLRL